MANRILANGYIVNRNTVWKDNTFFAVDFRADKNFRLSERFKLQASVDAFNLTNRANFGGNYTNNIRSSAFASATARA